MCMTFDLTQETRLAMIQSLQLNGGATSSIFPQVEAVLFHSADYQRAIEFVAKRKNVHRYESLMDFLFCELHPEYIWACKRYYAHQGPALRDILTVKQLLLFNDRLLKAIDMAHTLFCEKRAKSWREFQQEVREAVCYVA